MNSNNKNLLLGNDLFEWSQSISRMGSWYVDVINNKVFWSEETYRIHELDSSIEVDMEEAINFYHEEDRETIMELVQNCISTGRTWDVVLRIVTAEQNVKTVRAAGRPVHDPRDNKLLRLEGIFQELDLTKSISEDAAYLSKKSRFLEDAVERILIIAKTDSKGRITYVNDHFCEISKYSREELLGQNHRIINSDHHPSSFFEGMWETILSGKPWRGQIKNRAKDGSYYWVDTQILPSFDAKGEIEEFVSFRMEITNQVEKVESDIKMAKLAVVGETTAQIIHDVMNPLAIIQGNVDRIERQIDIEGLSEESLAKSMGRISGSVERIQSLFNDLRKGLIQDSQLKEISVNNLMLQIFQDLEEIAEQAGVSLRVKEQSAFNILGDESKLRQAFTNLIKNGIDAVRGTDSAWVEVSYDVQGMYKYIFVTDSGKGIPEEIHKKIFDSLFTTKQDSGGTGLGLGLVKKIINVHDGKIKVNPDSANTQFEISFKN